MPRNGAGTYSLPSNSFNPAVTDTTIESSAWNATANDLASALTQSISKDGQTTWVGNDNHGNYKITNLGNGTTSTDAIAYGQAAKLAVANTFSADQTINGAVSLSGSLTVTGPVIFSSGSITVEALGVTSLASVASLNVTGNSTLNTLGVASTASVNNLTAGVLSVGSSIVIGAASGGSKGAGTINAKGYYLDGASITTGTVIQVVSYETGSVATGSTVLPIDNTIPQNTEGDQYMSLAITPTSATNKLLIQVVIVLASSAASTQLAAALFQDSTANALAVVATGYIVNNPNVLSFSHYMTAGTTSATTFKVRAGAGAAGTTTFNGVGGARLFGGVMASSITITECV